MATADRNGPALDQDVLVYQGAPASYRVPISNPDGTRPDLSQATAFWWAGPKPARRPLSPNFTIANAPGAVTKPLSIVPDGAGAYQVILPIEPADLAGFPPAGIYQHEVWIAEAGAEAYPAAIGALLIDGTVKGAAA